MVYRMGWISQSMIYAIQTPDREVARSRTGFWQAILSNYVVRSLPRP